MNALRKVRALVHEYREEFGLSKTALAIECGMYVAAFIIVAFQTFAFSVVTP